jgi:hypothetical protein
LSFLCDHPVLTLLSFAARSKKEDGVGVCSGRGVLVACWADLKVAAGDEARLPFYSLLLVYFFLDEHF